MSILTATDCYRAAPNGLLARAAQKLIPHVFALGRRCWPIPGAGSFYAVLLYDDVLEVFANDKVFSAPYAENLAVLTDSEPFFLGMGDTPAYRQQLGAMRAVVRDDDLDGLARGAEANARAFVAASGGRLDVVDMVRRVTFDLLGDYFGVPPPAEGRIEVWASRLFEFQFTGSVKNAAWLVEVRELSAAFRAHLDAVIAARKAGGTGPDDVLQRCLALQAQGVPGYSDVEIRTALLCMVVGGPPQPPMVVPQALDQLLRRPHWLAQARDAALAGSDDRLRPVVMEAMRFDPLAPGLLRKALSDWTVARGTPRARKIPKDARVLAAFASAMMDSRRIDEPREFRPERVAAEYIHFGHGLHECFGRFINHATLHRMLKPLLEQPGLRRARGSSGRLTKRGGFADHLVVEFDG